MATGWLGGRRHWRQPFNIIHISQEVMMTRPARYSAPPAFAQFLLSSGGWLSYRYFIAVHGFASALHLLHSMHECFPSMSMRHNLKCERLCSLHRPLKVLKRYLQVIVSSYFESRGTVKRRHSRYLFACHAAWSTTSACKAVLAPQSLRRCSASSEVS